MNFVRYLQGERPGFGSELQTPDHTGELLARVSLSPSILVAQQVLVPDVSFYQSGIDFRKMKAAGASGVIIRAGQRTWVDSQFKANWAAARAAGLPRGSYWFYDSREDPVDQAALWWSLVRDDPGELVHTADLEESYGGPYGKPEHMRSFVAEFQRFSGWMDERIAIYTGYYWWVARVGADTWWRQYGLWLAWYADMSVVRIPGPWDEAELLFWQWTSSGDGPKYGVSSQEIDLNWYCCSPVHFDQRFGLDLPGTGDPMALYEGIAPTVNVRVRKGNPDGTPNPAGTTIEQINTGQSFKADGIAKDLTGKDWYHVVEAHGRAVDGFSAAWLLQLNATPPTPPTTTLPDMTYTITLGDGVSYETATITGVLKALK